MYFNNFNTEFNYRMQFALYTYVCRLSCKRTLHICTRLETVSIQNLPKRYKILHSSKRNISLHYFKLPIIHRNFFQKFGLGRKTQLTCFFNHVFFSFSPFFQSMFFYSKFTIWVWISNHQLGLYSPLSWPCSTDHQSFKPPSLLVSLDLPFSAAVLHVRLVVPICPFEPPLSQSKGLGSSFVILILASPSLSAGVQLWSYVTRPYQQLKRRLSKKEKLPGHEKYLSLTERIT